MVFPYDFGSIPSTLARTAIQKFKVRNTGGPKRALTLLDKGIAAYKER
jgi:hypothetical protein